LTPLSDHRIWRHVKREVGDNDLFLYQPPKEEIHLCTLHSFGSLISSIVILSFFSRQPDLIDLKHFLSGISYTDKNGPVFQQLLNAEELSLGDTAIA